MALKDKEIVKKLETQFGIISHIYQNIVPDATQEEWDDIWWCLNSYCRIENFNVKPFLEAFQGHTSNSDHLAEIFLRTNCDEEILEIFLDCIDPGSPLFTEALSKNAPKFSDSLVSLVQFGPFFEQFFDEDLLQLLLKHTTSEGFRAYLHKYGILERDLSIKSLQLLSDNGGIIDRTLLKGKPKNEIILLELLENFWQEIVFK